MTTATVPDRKTIEDRALKAITAARSSLLVDLKPETAARSAFFATLALRLRLAANWSIPTFCTDGKSLEYNPSFALSLNRDELVGVLVHEIMHCSNGHMTRRGSRVMKKWNEACDLSVNSLLLKAGFVLPEGGLIPGGKGFEDMPELLAAEAYYDLLTDEDEQEQEEQGDGGSGQDGDEPQDGSNFGDFKEPSDPAKADEIEAEWKVATAQAAQIAKNKGDLPASLARVVSEICNPTQDWRALLRRFINDMARNDYAWTRPNRRMLSHGLIMPGLRSEELGTVVVAIDTSGSIGQKQLDMFASELESALSAYQCKAVILYHDSAIAHVDEWQTSDGPIQLAPHGGGGTSHICVFDYIEQNEINPACLIAFTDLWTDFPMSVPEYPTLWAVTGNSNPSAPFGEIVTI